MQPWFGSGMSCLCFLTTRFLGPIFGIFGEPSGNPQQCLECCVPPDPIWFLSLFSP